MPDKLGPLLKRTLDRLSFASSDEDVLAIASVTETKSNEKAVPIVVKIPTIKPATKESWQHYRDRVQNELAPLQTWMQKTMSVDPVPLFTANSLQVVATRDQIQMLSKQARVRKMELDPLLPVALLDDSANDLLLGTFRTKHPTLDGTGVKVAVLDSGVDTQHPFLNVSHSVSTSGESVDIPGQHGTHCAGIIASRDLVFSGVAPGVDLLNIKVLDGDGSGRHTNITKGIDEALDQEAQVISMSLGFNHLPAWSNGGHGWTCTNGHCPLCTAVDNAVTLDNAIVVVAAGNEHNRAQALRDSGSGDSFDTELACPGQARKAITVGALTKQTFVLASFSSRGPTSFNESKPILCAPGVNIRSTVPVPREGNGQPIANPERETLFNRNSGTSMATPFVAGVAALLIQKQTLAGKPWTPDEIRKELLARGVAALSGLPNEVGGGRLSLGKF
jgi:serine protease AprX